MCVCDVDTAPFIIEHTPDGRDYCSCERRVDACSGADGRRVESTVAVDRVATAIMRECEQILKRLLDQDVKF